MVSKNSLLLFALLIILAAAIYFGTQSSTVNAEFTVKNFAGTELGKISVNYTQPLDQYEACEIATLASTQTSLPAFECTGFNKDHNDNYQIVFQPNQANIFVFNIDEEKGEVRIDIGQKA